MRAVIDTNVLLVANNDHQDISQDCVISCTNHIRQVATNGTAVIDTEFKILGEYLNKLNTSARQPGVGDAFLKWLMQHQSDNAKVAAIPISESSPDWFDEFRDQSLQEEFDPPDRKFIAVAAADPEKPVVLQAADSKWLNWWEQLSEMGVNTCFVCQSDIKRFYQNKFNGPIPDFPESD